MMRHPYPRLLTSCISLFLGIICPITATSYTDITDVGVSARMIGHGYISGFTNNASAIFENPASLTTIKEASIAGFTTTLFEDIHYNNIAFATHTVIGTFAVGYMDASILNIPFTGQVPETENTDKPFYVISEFDYKTTQMKVGYQLDLSQKFSIGASATRYETTYHTLKGVGYNVDVGALWQIKNIKLSTLIKNSVQNRKVTYSTGKTEDLDLDLRIGGEIKLWDVRVSGAYQNKSDQHGVKAAIDYLPSLFPYINIYSGIKEGVIQNKRQFTSTFGFTLILKPLYFDYSFQKSEHPSFDNNHYLSLSLDL